MDVISLHSFDPAIAQQYVAALNGTEPPQPAWSDWWNDALPSSLGQAKSGDERAANRISLGLAWALAGAQPSYLIPGFGLTAWEARIDRGVGMFLRPPSRLFLDAGLSAATSRAMPIRLDPHLGMMGGAYIPVRLLPEVHHLLETQLERTVRRLLEADYDPFATLGMVFEVVDRARSQGHGLFEAMDAFGPDGEGMPGMQVILADPKRLDHGLRRRIDLACREPKKPGLLARLLGRHSRTPEIIPNGHIQEK